MNGVNTLLVVIKHRRSSRCHALPKRDSGAPLLLKRHESKDFFLSIFFLRLQFCFSCCYPWNDSDRLQQQHALIRVNRPAAVGAATWERTQQQPGSNFQMNFFPENEEFVKRGIQSFDASGGMAE